MKKRNSLQSGQKNVEIDTQWNVNFNDKERGKVATLLKNIHADKDYLDVAPV